jgi:hypothetical protein
MWHAHAMRGSHECTVLKNSSGFSGRASRVQQLVTLVMPAQSDAEVIVNSGVALSDADHNAE